MIRRCNGDTVGRARSTQGQIMSVTKPVTKNGQKPLTIDTNARQTIKARLVEEGLYNKNQNLNNTFIAILVILCGLK